MRFAMRAALSAAMLATVFGCGKDSGPSGANKAGETAALQQSAKLDPDCAKCRVRSCAGNGANQESLDLAAGCFEKPDPKLVPNPDAKFTSDCRAVMECAFKHDCAYDPAKGPVHCYCGSRALDECVAQGPAEDAPCTAEWTAATRGQSNKEVLERFSQIEYPSGWAFHLLECDRDYCGATSELGRCTP